MTYRYFRTGGETTLSRKLQLVFGAAMSIPAVEDVVYRSGMIAGVTKRFAAAASRFTAATLHRCQTHAGAFKLLGKMIGESN